MKQLQKAKIFKRNQIYDICKRKIIIKSKLIKNNTVLNEKENIAGT